ncbi:MAG: VOC family protein [Vulcanimicrobiota bacterium]
MSRQIFVNLPVHDLPRSRMFFEALGYSFNPQFSNDSGACMIISEHIYAMLLTHDKFKGFTPLPVSDAHRQSEVLICLSCDSRSHVDELVSKALQAGGTTFKPPDDHGFMYGHSFQDLDGHIWELVYMEPGPVQG